VLENTRKGIYALLLDLVRIPSVSASPSGENRLAVFLRNRLAELPYFQENPKNLFLADLEGDPLRRTSLFAFVEAVPSTPRTVILTGHYDVVDVDVCGALKTWAFDAEEYTRRIGDVPLPEEAARDLASGNYLFGRGVMDMKCGLAIQAALLAEYAADPGKLGVNLLFLAVPDEENNSAGMRLSVPHLVRFARERGLDYLACIDGEPSDAGFCGGKGGGNASRRMYFVGTAGKIMPAFLFLGKEAHAGEYFGGFNATLPASRLVQLLEGNPRFVERLGTEALTPPTCLKLKDLRDIYSVTLPERAAAYFNVMTLSRTPAQVLKEMTSLAGQALAEALEQARENAKSFGDEAFRTFTEETLRVGTSERGEYPVRTYQDVRALARDVYDRTNASAGTSLEAYEEAFLAALPSGMDERDRALALMGEVVNLSGLKGPLAVVGFVPPYYPHRGNLRCSDKEHALLEALAAVAAKGREEFGEEIAYVEYFGGITDMSFLGFQGEPEALAALAENMPGWGKLYSLPLEDLLRLDVPVANIGPAGKDAHKDTERLELDFSLRVAPELLRCAVEHLGRS